MQLIYFIYILFQFIVRCFSIDFSKFCLFFRQAPSTDLVSADTKLMLEEITRCLNLEKLLPCYKYTVTVRYILNSKISITMVSV